MSRIPKGFGGGSKKDKVDLSKSSKVKYTKKPISTKAPSGVVFKEPIIKRKADPHVIIEDLTEGGDGAPHKKHKASSSSSIPLVSSELSTLPIFVTDEEVQSWKKLSNEEEEDAIDRKSVV